MAHYKTYRIVVNRKREGGIHLALEGAIEMLEPLKPGMFVDVRLDDALNLIRHRDFRKLDTFAVLETEETVLFIITTVPLSRNEKDQVERELGTLLEPCM